MSDWHGHERLLRESKPLVLHDDADHLVRLARADRVREESVPPAERSPDRVHLMLHQLERSALYRL